jgi:hypothetical protein
MTKGRVGGRLLGVHAAQEALLAGTSDGPVARPAVQVSWERCQAMGVDPSTATAPIEIADDALDALRQAHPLAAAMPVVRQLLVEHARDSELIVAVSDAQGRLLWVEGHSGLRRRAEGMHFTPGARWDEAHAGTNAPGVALATGAAARIRDAEHWAVQVQPFSCSAAPVHDPRTGVLLGAVDLTGDARAAAPASLALVQATVAAVERELLLQALQRSPEPTTDRGRLELAVLGSHAGLLTVSGRQIRLSLRRAELLLLLAEYPDGLSAEALAVALNERELDAGTVRVEVSRLRHAVGVQLLAGRPYRLTMPLHTDVEVVRAHLDVGEVAAAVAAYPGPVLPRSQAPGVIQLRERLEHELRTALLLSADPALMHSWLREPGRRDDLPLWHACLHGLPPGPERDRVAAELSAVDRELR